MNGLQCKGQSCVTKRGLIDRNFASHKSLLKRSKRPKKSTIVIMTKLYKNNCCLLISCHSSVPKL